MYVWRILWPSGSILLWIISLVVYTIVWDNFILNKSFHEPTNGMSGAFFTERLDDVHEELFVLFL